MDKDILLDIEKDIEDIFFKYLEIRSTSNTSGELLVEAFWLAHFSGNEYFHKHPEYMGTFPIEGDLLGRKVLYAFLKGKGNDTVVLLHHHDVVDTDDFKSLQDFAYHPDRLAAELKKISNTLSTEAMEDLLGEEYFFGRGTADMKGGGAIQMALLDRYSRMLDFKGNILLLSVPDEENLSAGMRSAVKLMQEIKEKHSLEYLMLLNSEPYQITENSEGVIDEGSIGKALFFFYVRGALAHAGRVFEGINALSILSEIVTRTEINMRFADLKDGEVSTPPTWLYMRDRKTCYDVSVPLGAGGYLSMLSLTTEMEDALDILKEISTIGFSSVIASINEKYDMFCKMSGKSFHTLPWQPKVVTFRELYDEAFSCHGQAFQESYNKKYDETLTGMAEDKVGMLESNLLLTEFIFNYIDDLSPRVVIGISPPYYPHVTNSELGGINEKARMLTENLIQFAKNELGKTYKREKFFTGISDLSYTSVDDGNRINNILQGNMPHFGRLYRLPFETIEKISMPGMNIGPCGKDLHKMTERVLKKDLYYNTPRILHQAISMLLE